jgi:hypothetical protein
MRNLTATLCLTFAVLLFSAGEGFALPPCPEDNSAYRNNCFGTYTFANGDKYVGEWRDDKRYGQGTYHFLADNQFKGDIYVGEFKDDKPNGQGTYTYADGRVVEGIWRRNKFLYAQKVTPPRRSEPPVVARVSPKKPEPKPSPPIKTGSSGSGFFVSKLGHVITNQHVVRDCGSVTVGDNANKQVTADVLETDRKNDLALLQISSTSMASAETKSLIRKLGIRIVPLSSNDLLRSEDVELGEDVLVAGFPYGDMFSNTIKVTKGIVSAVRGIGDDSGQFQMDAAVQPGNSGGPIQWKFPLFRDM